MQVTQSSVGRKIIMAVTGTMLIAFVCVHLLGNSSLFFGSAAINAYAQKLHSLGPVVWIFRLVMLGLIAVHIYFGIQLTLENRAATPDKNVQVKRPKTGFAAETMVVSGLVLLAFVVVAALVAVLIHRVTNPVKRLISNFDDYLSWFLTAAPLATGMLAYAHAGGAPYETLPGVHILSAEALMVWFPFGKLMHTFFIFAARGTTGMLFERKGASL